MTDVLRIVTPDFEINIWTNSVDKQQQVYRKAMLKRGMGPTSSPSLPFKISPPQKINHLEVLEDVPSFLIPGSTYSGFVLGSPIFFENTHYLIEINFCGQLSRACVNHRNIGVNKCFRFTAAKHNRSAHLTGAINTGNDIGWFNLPIEYVLNDETKNVTLGFEILPTKLDLKSDLSAMYQVIDKEFPLWRFSLLNPTEQAVSRDSNRGYFPLLWIANFKRLKEKFERGLKVITQAPHTRLQTVAHYYRADRLKGRIKHRLEERIQEDMLGGSTDKRYRVEQKRLSVDTPENRYVKAILKTTLRRIRSIERKLESARNSGRLQDLSDSFIRELRGWCEPLSTVERQSFFKDVGEATFLHRESLVLQQKTGYNIVYSVWQELKFYLDAFENHTTISMKSISEIYEVWCFLEIRRILIEELHFIEIHNKKAALRLTNGIEHELSDGFAGSFEFRRPTDGLIARLAHEPVIGKKGDAFRSYAVTQKPDIVIRIEVPQSNKHLIWVFDAKYRLKGKDERFESTSDDIDNVDLVPDDALNQMHRYRDAIIRLTKAEQSSHRVKSRPVVGAFALYPGYFQQKAGKNPYQDTIREIGIGAFALLPSVKGSTTNNVWLCDFLKEQLALPAKHSSEGPFSQLEEKLHNLHPTRIPLHGMHQVLYPDLTLTTSLGPSANRDSAYFDGFRDGTARHYHIPMRTFDIVFQQHIVNELRFLAIMQSHIEYSDIEYVWPIRRVQLLKRRDIPFECTGKDSSSEELYYLFTLSFPLQLPTKISNNPNDSFRKTLRLTTLEFLEKADSFQQIVPVYKEALLS